MLERIQLLLRQHRFKQAEELCQQALQQDPENASIWQLLGQALLAQQQLDAAASALQQALSLEPEADFTYYLLAHVALAQAKPVQAKQMIQHALSLAPFIADYHTTNGFVELSLGHPKLAVQAAQAGLAADPLHVGSHNLQARALAVLGNREASQATLATSLHHDPTSSTTHTNAGLTYLEAGNHAQARYHFAEALRLDPQQEDARAGLLKAYKSRFWPYRWLFRSGITLVYFAGPALLQTSPLGRSLIARAVPLLLSLVFWRLILASSLFDTANLSFSDTYMLFLALLVCTVILLYICNIIFDSFLRLDPHARYALTEAEIHRSNVFLGALPAISLFIGLLVVPLTSHLLILGLGLLGLLSPLLMGFYFPSGSSSRRSLIWPLVIALPIILALWSLPNEEAVRLWLFLVSVGNGIYLWAYSSRWETTQS